MQRRGRKPGRTYPERIELYATTDQVVAWTETAERLHIGRNDLLRRAIDHALVCPLFLADSSPKRTDNAAE